ncbi:MAG: hypothetical protein Q7T74_00350 [Candidatus Saccharibacteria bacterium]|nr:hypothetical protein [Candidatus Saccharibacteria bacterium]
MDENVEVYEFDGELFENVGDFLQALAHEYKVGDSELAISTLEDYGFDISDIGVRPKGV